ncbi:hypothetical protein KIPB_014263, partial [Kipferlia bialata]
LESTRSRVQHWSLFRILVLFAVMAGQTVILKRFFDAKKTVV